MIQTVRFGEEIVEKTLSVVSLVALIIIVAIVGYPLYNKRTEVPKMEIAVLTPVDENLYGVSPGQELPLMKLSDIMRQEELNHSDLYGDYFVREREREDRIRLSCAAKLTNGGIADVQLLEKRFIFVIDNTKTTPTITLSPDRETVTVKISLKDYDRMKKVESPLPVDERRNYDFA